MKNSLSNVIDFNNHRSLSAIDRTREKLKKPCSCGAQANGSPNGRTPLLTTEQACEYLQCTPRFLQKMVRDGRLRALKPSRKLTRYRQSDLDAFMDKGATTWADINPYSRWRVTRTAATTPLKAAKKHCANYQPDGSCLGIALRDDLSMYRFRGENLPCVFSQGQCEACPYFEETVLPQVSGIVAVEYRKSLPTTLAADARPQRSARKRCRVCKKREVGPRQKYCPSCARNSKRKSNRQHISRKRRRSVGKLANSPSGPEPLTTAVPTTRYIDPAAADLAA